VLGTAAIVILLAPETGSSRSSAAAIAVSNYAYDGGEGAGGTDACLRTEAVGRD
jgi:hypothetical protein